MHERAVVRPAPRLGEEDEEERRRVDRAVVAGEPELGGAAVAHLVDDLPGLGVDRRVLARRLQLGERVQRADRDLGAEQERLQRGDRRVAAEHGHEPGHAGGEERPPRLAGAHAERREVVDRAVERATQALPPAAHPRHAERPGRDDVAERLALLVEALAALGVALPVERRDGPRRSSSQRSCGSRVEVEDDIAAVLETARLREHDARPQVAAWRLDDQLPRSPRRTRPAPAAAAAARARDRRARSRGASPR